MSIIDQAIAEGIDFCALGALSYIHSRGAEGIRKSELLKIVPNGQSTYLRTTKILLDKKFIVRLNERDSGMYLSPRFVSVDFVEGEE